MTCNSNLFTTFQSHLSTSTVTLADESTSCILRSWTIHPTTLINLTSVLSLSQFYFNLISVSKPTRTLNCNISFFPDYCLIQDLSIKRIIDKGYESGDLYILEPKVHRLLLVLELLPHSNYIVVWVILLSPLKKLYPRFSSISSLNYESYQYAKFHRVHLSPRVNK